MLTPIAGLGQIKIVYTEFACDPEYEKVERSWRERLFTRPWNPDRKFNVIMKELNPKAYFLPQSGIFVAHPVFKEEIERSMEMGKNKNTSFVMTAKCGHLVVVSHHGIVVEKCLMCDIKEAIVNLGNAVNTISELAEYAGRQMNALNTAFEEEMKEMEND